MKKRHGAIIGVGSAFALSLGLVAMHGIATPSPVPTPQLEGQDLNGMSAQERLALFMQDNPRVDMYLNDVGQIRRVYGKSFSHGATAADSAAAFVEEQSAMFGDLGELRAEAHHLEPGQYMVPASIDPETGAHRFTIVYYQQYVDDVPVYRSRMTMTVRNEANHPLVLAAPEVYDLAGWRPDAQQIDRGLSAPGRAVIQRMYGREVTIGETSDVVYAGIDGMPEEPRLAHITMVSPVEHDHYNVLTDAQSGAILHIEQLVCQVDVVGNVSGRASEGPAADFCEEETLQPMPYMRVHIGAQEAYSDINGDFTIPNGGSFNVNVESEIDGLWFDVYNFAGAEPTESVVVSPPGPANLIFNDANTSEQVRAQVNCYVEANRIRDRVLSVNGSYPTMDFANYLVTANRNDGFCPGNAWYDPSDNGGNGSINFCLAGGGFPNTAWTSVIHHEYGHHLVNAGGSGQGQYGEGTGDVMSIIMLDTNLLGLGFFGTCNEPLRDPVANHRDYPCNGGSHDCGQLISGCVWDTRNALTVTEPANYIEILSDLAINSILMHNGSNIAPDITIDWLTLDDDDDDILNGTPHYNEIAAGFGAHNMDAPELSLIDFSYPNGRPDTVDPNGGNVIRVSVESLGDSPVAGSGQFFVDTGSGFQEVAMNQISDNVYDATMPASTCGSTVSYYFSAEAEGGQTITDPSDAPGNAFTALSAGVGSDIVFDDNFQSDMGWSVTNNVTDGQWERGVPAGGGDRGDPPVDADGSGACYLTDNEAGNSDVDGGTTTLTSPTMDASGDATVISYHRWYSNTFGADPENDTFVVQISDDNGSTWQGLETVGPAGPEVDGGWFYKEFSLNDIDGFELNNQFRIRFLASDLSSGSVVEAGVDGVRLIELDCGSPCVGDISGGDGTVDVNDLLELLANWGTDGNGADIAAPNNIVDVNDLLALLAAWGDC